MLASAAPVARAQRDDWQDWQQQQTEESLTKLARENKLREIYSKDPWRNLGGTTNLAHGAGWYVFRGAIQKVQDGGSIIRGAYSDLIPMRVEKLGLRKWADPNNYRASVVYELPGIPDSYLGHLGVEFFVANYPYQEYAQDLMAHYEGYYTYTNSSGHPIVIKKFDYGICCEKIWSPEEIAAEKAKADAKKRAVADRVLKNNQDLADKGDAYGLLRMGERYRDGEGVPKDLTKARDYLTKAAEAGSQTAADELKKLAAN